MEEWKLIMKGFDCNTYNKSEFSQLKQYCEQIIEDGMSDYYKIEYYRNGKLQDSSGVLDYFGS